MIQNVFGWLGTGVVHLHDTDCFSHFSFAANVTEIPPLIAVQPGFRALHNLAVHHFHTQCKRSLSAFLELLSDATHCCRLVMCS